MAQVVRKNIALKGVNKKVYSSKCIFPKHLLSDSNMRCDLLFCLFDTIWLWDITAVTGIE